MAAAVMSTDTNLLPRRRRPITYGKHSQRSTLDFAALGAQNSPDRNRLAKPSHTVTPTKPSSRILSNNAVVFDIPSSEDESPISTIDFPPTSQRRTKHQKHESVYKPPIDNTSNIFDVPFLNEDIRAPRRSLSSRKDLRANRKTTEAKRNGSPSVQLNTDLHGSLGSLPDHVKRRRISGSSEPSERRSTSQLSRSNSELQLRQQDLHIITEAPLNNDVCNSTSSNSGINLINTKIVEKRGHAQEHISDHAASRKPVASAKSAPATLRPMVESVKPSMVHEASKSSVCLSQYYERFQPRGGPNSSSTSRPKAGSLNGERIKVTTTPKQAKLWSSLLIHDERSIPVANRTSLQHTFLSQAQSKKRLIDTLEASAESIWSSDEDEAEVDLSGAGVPDEINSPYRRIVSTHDNPHVSQTAPSTRLQSRLTYAGQRSYLDESAGNLLTQSLDFGIMPLSADGINTSVGSFKQNNPRALVESSDEEDGGSSMKTIHELRASGDSIRFENDLFLDDLELSGKSALSRKRSALLEICHRLENVEFRDRFAQFGLELRIILACRAEGDPIVGTAIATILLYTLSMSASMHTALQLYEAGTIEFLGRLLSSRRDIMSIAKDRAANMSKVSQTSISEFKNTLVKSALWSEKQRDVSLSPMLVALKCLDVFVQRLRRSKMEEPILTSHLLMELLGIFKLTLKGTCNQEHDTSEQDVVLLKTILSVMESFTIVDSCASNSSLWNAETLAELVEGLDSAMSLSTFHVQILSPLILRLCLNLANNNANNCRPFSKPTFIQKLMSSVVEGFKSLTAPVHSSKALRDFDNLLLALAAMFNLAEWNDSVRLVTLRDCRENLNSLLETFISSRANVSEADSLAASSVNVAHGYLAVLLGHLCQNGQVRNHVRSKLPIGSLSSLSMAVEEFIVHHKEADKGQESNENWIAFTHRLTLVAESLKGILPEI